MVNDIERERFNWQLPFYTASVTIVVCVLEALAEPDGTLYFLLLVPIVSLFFLGFLLFAAIAKKPRRCLAILSMLAVFWILSFALLKNHYSIRNVARWSLWSHRYKAEVLAQPDSANKEFKHIEWDGWGFPGAGDTTVYLVFDPKNSLSQAAKTGIEGIPCKVAGVTRLESRWYAVLFYTDERWGRPHWDCGVAG
jgi:hypothetical protein